MASKGYRGEINPKCFMQAQLLAVFLDAALHDVDKATMQAALDAAQSALNACGGNLWSDLTMSVLEAKTRASVPLSRASSASLARVRLISKRQTE